MGIVVWVVNMKRQKKPGVDKKSGQEMAQSGSEFTNRFHVDYWRKRIFRKAYVWEGQRREVEEWSIRLQHLGRREAFALGTANAATAAAKAKEIATYLDATGWDSTLTRFKPEMQKKIKAPTVGEYLEAARAVANIAPGTFDTYATKLRTLVAGVVKIKTSKIERPLINEKTGAVQRSRKTGELRTEVVDPRFDYVNGGAKAWRERVEAVRLDKVTPQAVQKWVTTRLQEAASNPAKAASARTTVNSILRAAGSLFTSSITRHLKHLDLPSPLPFDGVEKPSVPRRRYESRINPQILNQKAEAELRMGVGLPPPNPIKSLTI